MARSLSDHPVLAYEEKTHSSIGSSIDVVAEEEASERVPLLGPPPYAELDGSGNLSEKKKRRRKRCCSCSCAYVLPALILLFSGMTLGFSIVYWSTPLMSAIPNEEVPVRIAIVGAGPAGISTAYALNALLELSKIPVNITVLEAKPNAGGRMFISTGLGASSGLSRVQGRIQAEDVATGDLMMGNQLLAGRAKEALNYTGSDSDNGNEKSVRVGYFDGEAMKLNAVATRPDSAASWSEWFNLVFKYGSAVLRSKQLPVGTVLRFRRMMAKGGALDKTIPGVEQWLIEAKMLETVSMGAEERLRKNGIAGAYVDDFIKAQVQRQWSQDIEEISDLALSVGLEREHNGLGQSEGGRNWVLGDVLKGFLEESNAEVRLDTEVKGVSSVVNDDGKKEWVLELNSDDSATHANFDHVILAAPWDTSSLLGKKEKETYEQISYRSQWLTLVVTTGKFNTTYFGETDPSNIPDEFLPTVLPSTDSDLAGITAITSLRPVFAPDSKTNAINTEAVKYLYRITSSNRVSKERLSAFFQGEIEEVVQEEVKNAYPLLYPRTAGFGNFKVQQGLWHTAVGEAIVSGVDWSWVIGERIALIIWQELKDRKRK